MVVRSKWNAPARQAALYKALSQYDASIPNPTNLSLEQRKALALAGARLRVQKQGLDSDQMIRVRAPDGTLVQFPPGTSLEVMKDAMRRKYGGPKGGPWEEYQGTRLTVLGHSFKEPARLRFPPISLFLSPISGIRAICERATACSLT